MAQLPADVRAAIAAPDASFCGRQMPGGGNVSRGFWVVIAAVVFALGLYAVLGVIMSAWLTAIPGYSRTNGLNAFYSWLAAAVALFVMFIAAAVQAMRTPRRRRT